MDVSLDIGILDRSIAAKAKQKPLSNATDKSAGGKPNKRGRPKGARSASLSDVRQQAAEEKKRIKAMFQHRIHQLQDELEALEVRYSKDVSKLEAELKLHKRREKSYQTALGSRLQEVADHIHSTVLNWGTAELEEAQIDKRKRGRPRKTLK